MLSLLPLGLLAIPAVHATGFSFFARDATTNSTSSTTVEMVSASWYAGWNSDDFPLDDVSWDKYTHIYYSFATTSASPDNVTLAASDEVLLPQFVSKAKANGTTALATIGGWGGSIHFSSNVGSEESRTAYAKAVSNFISTYELDGVDFDWEYPNSENGLSCNIRSADDTSNFLSFLQTLRTEVGNDVLLTASVPIVPWNDASGSASTNVSGFADVLDWINVMNYDVWGSWSPGVGPNSPLNDTCAPLADQQGSAVSAVAKWTAAGIPAHQIVLGVASYGHSFFVDLADALISDGTALASYPLFVASKQPLGDAWDDTTSVDACGDTSGPSGVYNFWALVGDGFLFKNGSVAEGIDYRYDECSQTPYIYNPCTSVMISYDNAESFAAKGNYVKSANLRGFAMWQTGGDYDDILIDSIRTAAGFDDDDDC